MSLPGNGSGPIQPAGAGVEADGLRIDHETNGPVVTVRVAGEIDALTAPRVQQAVDEAYGVPGVSHVLLDLTEVGFLGSAGLSVLVTQHERGLTANVPLYVIAAQHATRRAIEVTSLDQVLHLYPSVADALRAVA